MSSIELARPSLICWAALLRDLHACLARFWTGEFRHDHADRPWELLNRRCPRDRICCSNPRFDQALDEICPHSALSLGQIPTG